MTTSQPPGLSPHNVNTWVVIDANGKTHTPPQPHHRQVGDILWRIDGGKEGNFMGEDEQDCCVQWAQHHQIKWRAVLRPGETELVVKRALDPALFTDATGMHI